MNIRVISGGQTGVDRAGLEAAHQVGFETGGWAPKRFMTEKGPDEVLGSLYGLLEHHSAHYADRTYANVQMADVTFWFGTGDSAGFKCTRNAALYFEKPFVIDATSSEIVDFVRNNKNVCVINIAGNRASRNPFLGPSVRSILLKAFYELKNSGVPENK